MIRCLARFRSTTEFNHKFHYLEVAMATQTLIDSIWYVPFSNQNNCNLASAYQEDADPANALEDGKPFVIMLERVHISTIRKNILQITFPGLSKPDLAIGSSSAMGDDIPVQRVLAVNQHVDPETPFDATNFLSDEIYLCDQYDATRRLFAELTVRNVGTILGIENALASIDNFTNQAGALYPPMLPYVTVADKVVNGIDKLFNSAGSMDIDEFKARLDIRPPSELCEKIMQCGRYVLFQDDIDGFQYGLTANDKLVDSAGKPVEDISYLVFRIGKGTDAAIINSQSMKNNDIAFVDKVVHQKMAEILTLLNMKDHDGNPDMARRVIGLDKLKEVVQAYEKERLQFH